MRQVTNAAPALLAAVAGVGLYFLGSRECWWAAAAVDAVPLMVSYALLASGRRLLRTSPVTAVWLMSGWIIGVIAIGAAIIALLTAGTIAVTDALAGFSKTEADVVGGTITGAFVAFAGVVFTKNLDEGTGEIWPSAKTKQSMSDELADRFEPGTRAFEAVYENQVLGRPTAKGWGLRARLERARVIAEALQQRQPDAEGT